MEKRAARVSEAQWNILLDFLQRNPNLARSRSYNNSALGRAESLRLWTEISNVLNAEGSGTSKSPKDWSVYVSNYKSKLKKMVADINTDISGTGGGPSRRGALSDIDQRFLAILGPGFGQTAPRVSVNPFPNVDEEQPDATACSSQECQIPLQDNETEIIIQVVEEGEEPPPPHDATVPAPAPTVPVTSAQVSAAAGPEPVLPRRSRQARYRSRPLAPLDEARRILSQVEMQRAASDAATARALELMGQSMVRFADAHMRIADAQTRIADANTQLADAADRFLSQ